MKSYLIQFKAEYSCQGWEEADFIYLVYAQSYDNAIEKIKHYSGEEFEGDTARNFKNLTIE